MPKPIVVVVFLFLMVRCTVGEKESVSITIDLAQTKDSVEIFAPGVISTSFNERDLAIAPDGEEIVHTLSNYDNTIRALISTVKEGGSWEPSRIISFSGIHNDIEPFFTPDGTKLFFASDRPLSTGSERTDYNIWYAERSGTGWSNSKPIEGPINTEKDEFYPAVGRTGNLYFTASYADAVGREDIYLSRYENGAYQPPIPLDTAINSLNYEFNAYVSPDEKVIIFSSYGRKDDLGGGDLYISKKDATGKWQPAINMGPEINSDRLDYCPFIDIARGNFYFTSNRRSKRADKYQDIVSLTNAFNEILNGTGNIYRTKLTDIGINPAKKPVQD